MTKFIPTTNVFIKKLNKYLIIRRSNTVDVFKNFLMAPGGKQESNESITNTAIREMLEETGITIKNLKLKIIGTHNHSYKDTVYLVYIFTAEFKEGELKESDEGKPEWFTKAELINNELLWPDLKMYLPNIINKSNKILTSYIEYDSNFEMKNISKSYC